MLSRFLFATKIGVNYLKLRYRNFCYRKSFESSFRTVFVDLDDRRVGPYYYALLFFLHEGGFNIILKNNVLFIGGCLYADANIFSLPRLKVVDKLPNKKEAKNIVYLRDKKVYRKKRNWLKEVIIDPDVYSKRKIDHSSIVMPFPMNPALYVSGAYKGVAKFRSSERKMKMFFSGNQNVQAYSHPIFSEFFEKLNRIEVVETLVKELCEDEIKIIDDEVQLDQLKDEDQKKFVLVRWQWSASTSFNLKARVQNNDWLQKLAKSHFFLAPPGVRMPLCFNIIEAMSVGTIPVTEYPEIFNPPLEHLKNCIVFKGREDLVNKVKMALLMDEGKAKSMSIEVAEYYDTFLSVEPFIRKIRDGKEQKVTLYLYAEEASYQDYLKNNN